MAPDASSGFHNKSILVELLSGIVFLTDDLNKCIITSDSYRCISKVVAKQFFFFDKKSYFCRRAI